MVALGRVVAQREVEVRLREAKDFARASARSAIILSHRVLEEEVHLVDAVLQLIVTPVDFVEEELALEAPRNAQDQLTNLRLLLRLVQVCTLQACRRFDPLSRNERLDAAHEILACEAIRVADAALDVRPARYCVA